MTIADKKKSSGFKSFMSKVKSKYTEMKTKYEEKQHLQREAATSIAREEHELDADTELGNIWISKLNVFRAS